MSCVGETERDRERERGVLQSYGAGLIAASRLAACRCQRRCVKQFYCVQPAGESRSHKGFFVARRISALYSILFWCFAYKFCLRFTKIVSCPSNAVTVYLFIMSSMIFLVSMNRLCSVYPVCGQSRGYFSASVWDVFRDLAF